MLVLPFLPRLFHGEMSYKTFYIGNAWSDMVSWHVCYDITIVNYDAYGMSMSYDDCQSINK